MAFLLAFGVFAALIIASTALYRYGNIQRQHPLVTFSVLIAWSFSFLIVFTIPLDVTSTVYRQCIHERDDTQQQVLTASTSNATTDCQKPWGMVPDSVFPNLWRIIYWSSQFLTWLIMPLMQSYLKAGDFTFKGKFKSAVIDNAIYYGSYLFICGVLLIYLAMKPEVHLDWSKLKAIASSASNTWGLFLLVLLLGYALVEVPRSLWEHSKPGVTLRQAYFKLAKLSTDKADAEEKVELEIETLQAYENATPLNHILRPHVETILRKVPSELLDRSRRATNRQSADMQTDVPPEKVLVRHHKKIIKSIQTFQRTEALWNVQVSKVLHLEDIDRNMLSVDRHFRTEYPQQRNGIQNRLYHPVLVWYWHCVVKKPFMRTMAVITGILSVMVVWSELTFFNRSPVLSIFANVVNVAKAGHDFLTIELISMLTLCYLCYCAYSTVFRIKFLDLYYLAPHHATNEHSLIFSGMLLCRLTPPMCLNFLGLIHMDSHIIKKRISETYYTQIMGHMDVLGIISDGFNIYFPMVMLAFCLATWYSLGSRALNVLGFPQFMSNDSGSEEVVEFVQEGRDVIEREKRRRQRAKESQSRRRDHQMIVRGASASSKHRNNDGNGNGGGDNNSLRGGGLLGAGSNYDYNTNQFDGDLDRRIRDDISGRFGNSTAIDIGFRGYNYIDSDNDDAMERAQRGPPRDLFDDV